MPRWLALAASAVIVSGSIAAAHHSIAGAYDSSRRVQIEGTIVAFQFINPHPLVEIDVPGDEGRVERWVLELDNRSELRRAGMTADTLKPGDAIAVSGSASRDGAPRLYVRELRRPADGFLYEQVGSSPRVRLPGR